jgi:hypothetical protein
LIKNKLKEVVEAPKAPKKSKYNKIFFFIFLKAPASAASATLFYSNSYLKIKLIYRLILNKNSRSDREKKNKK